MAYTVSQTPDGLTVIRVLPPEGSKRYSDWQAHLLKCGMAVDYTSGIDSEGNLKHRTTPCPQHYILDDQGEARIPCACCALPLASGACLAGTTRERRSAMSDMSRIRIGGLIFIDSEPVPHKTKPNTVVIHPRALLVSRLGLGCIPCQNRYFEQVQAVAKDNALIDHIATLYVKLTLAGKPVLNTDGKPKRVPSKRTPFIDIFGTGEVTA